MKQKRQQFMEADSQNPRMRNAFAAVEEVAAKMVAEAMRKDQLYHANAVRDELKAIQLYSTRAQIEEAKAATLYSSQVMRDQIRESQRYSTQLIIDEIKASQRFSTQAIRDEIRKAAEFSLRGLKAMKSQTLYSTQVERAMVGTQILDAIGENHYRIADSFRRAHTVARESLKVVSALPRFDEVQKIVSSFDQINRAQLGSISGSAAVAAVALDNPALESVFSSSSFANAVAESVRGVLATHRFDASAFEGLEELIDEKLANLPHDKVTSLGLYEVIRDIVLTMLTLAQVGGMGYQIYDAKQQTSEQGKKQIEIEARRDEHWKRALEFLEQVAKNTADRVPENDPAKYYLVMDRPVVLRVNPTTKAAKIVVLFPNQRVALVKEAHQWIYIEYFDYLEGVPRYGWAMKKYLRRLD